MCTNKLVAVDVLRAPSSRSQISPVAVVSFRGGAAGWGAGAEHGGAEPQGGARAETPARGEEAARRRPRTSLHRKRRL